MTKHCGNQAAIDIIVYWHLAQKSTAYLWYLAPALCKQVLPQNHSRHRLHRFCSIFSPGNHKKSQRCHPWRPHLLGCRFAACKPRRASRASRASLRSQSLWKQRSPSIHARIVRICEAKYFGPGVCGLTQGLNCVNCAYLTQIRNAGVMSQITPTAIGQVR